MRVDKEEQFLYTCTTYRNLHKKFHQLDIVLPGGVLMEFIL